MKTKILKFSSIILVVSLLLSACASVTSLIPAGLGAKDTTNNQSQVAPAQKVLSQNTNAVSSQAPASLSAYETALEDIYTLVNPSVVSIRVVQKQAISLNLNDPNSPFAVIPGHPNLFGAPGQNNNQPSTPQFSQALGSGFVWSTDGYIITNNHVINGADKIEVKFADGTTVPATLVGADPDSDLAVIKVDPSGLTLTPITIDNSTAVKVGQIAVAIGNPFGLENTMTVGIVSALGRTLPATEGSSVNGTSYSIPDIIQTDAPINPGNSGGPLLNDRGALVGVNSAIESSSNANSGIGFAIPATIVSRVVPELIKNGKYEHPYIGIGAYSLTPDVAKAMNLNPNLRGALVDTVQSGSPADQAGLHGSDSSVTIDGQDVKIGGDLITAIDGTPVKSIDDVIAYLADHTAVGQKVSLTILRGGKEQSLDVTLQARPATVDTTQTTPSNPQQGSAWLGIAGQAITPEINKEMSLPDNQTGVLVEQVQAGSPADKAGLQGSFKPVILGGQRVLVGGDVITAIDGKSITTFDDLLAFMQTAKPDQQITLTILRDGKEQTLTATLAQHP
jgi:S1-C subfamily serine protease